MATATGVPTSDNKVDVFASICSYLRLPAGAPAKRGGREVRRAARRHQRAAHRAAPVRPVRPTRRHGISRILRWNQSDFFALAVASCRIASPLEDHPDALLKVMYDARENAPSIVTDLSLRPYVRTVGALLLLASMRAAQAIAAVDRRLGEPGHVQGGRAYTIDGVTYTPMEELPMPRRRRLVVRTGLPRKSTANGEVYDQSDKTAAHRTYRCVGGARHQLDNGRSTVVRVNDTAALCRAAG